MIKQEIENYYSRPEFNNCKLKIFENDCEDEGCKLHGHFNDYIILNGDNIKKCLKKDEKSVDRIIFLKESKNKNVEVILCELSEKKKYTDVVEKIKRSWEYIFCVLDELGYKIKKFYCIFVGKYKNNNLVKNKPFSIPNTGKHNLVIKKLNCGDEFSEIFKV